MGSTHTSRSFGIYYKPSLIHSYADRGLLNFIYRDSVTINLTYPENYWFDINTGRLHIIYVVIGAAITHSFSQIVSSNW